MGDRLSILGFSASHTLTSQSQISLPNNNVLSVALSPQDLNSIKTAGIGLSNQSTFISLSELTAADMSGNANQGTETASELQVSALTVDTTRPSIASFDIDLNSGLLTLIFTETVRASSFNPSLVTLQSDAFGTDSSFSLTEGVLLGTDGPILRLQLSTGDFNLLKISPVARDILSTYLSFPDSLVQDSAGNSIVSVLSSLALFVQTYTFDLTNPQVSSIALRVEY